MARQFVERLARQRGVELPKGDIFSELAVKPGKGKTASGKKARRRSRPSPRGRPCRRRASSALLSRPRRHGGDAGEAHVDSHEPPPVVETAPAFLGRGAPAGQPGRGRGRATRARRRHPGARRVASTRRWRRSRRPTPNHASNLRPHPSRCRRPRQRRWRHPWPRLQPRRRRRGSPPVASCRRACACGSRNPARPCRRRGRSLRRSVRRASRRRGLSRRLRRRARVRPGSAPGSSDRWARARRTRAAVPIPRPRRRLVARARCPRSRCGRGSPVCRPVRVSTRSVRACRDVRRWVDVRACRSVRWGAVPPAWPRATADRARCRRRRRWPCRRSAARSRWLRA